MHRIIATSVAAALLASGAAYAQAPAPVTYPAWYLGIDAGQSRGPSGGDINSSFGAQGATGTSVDKTDTTWGLQLGYRFHPNWGIEGGWRDFGNFGYSTSTPGGGNISGEYRAKAWSLAGVGYVPLGASRFSAYGKLGVARTEVDRDVSSQTPGLTAASASSNRTGLMGGIGLHYDFERSWFARAGWDHYDRAGNDSTGKTSLDALTVGVGLRF